jgi:hypothetical protein
MLFKSVPVGGVFMIGSKTYVKYADFPKLGFGKIREILSGKRNPPQIMVYEHDAGTLVLDPRLEEELP